MIEKTVLIIDDEPDFLDVMSEYLSSFFGRVLTAENGRTGLMMSQSEPFDLIISDLNMPLMKGDDFLRQLRAQGNLTPVVFLTGNADKELAVTALRLGASDVFEKPVDFEVLKEGIQRIFEIQKREQALRAIDDPLQSHQAKKMIGLLRNVNEKKIKSS